MNKIPKTAIKLEVTSLTNTSGSKKGDIFIAEKQDNRWIANINGKQFCCFIQHLRNENFCNIKII